MDLTHCFFVPLLTAFRDKCVKLYKYVETQLKPYSNYSYIYHHKTKIFVLAETKYSNNVNYKTFRKEKWLVCDQNSNSEPSSTREDASTSYAAEIHFVTANNLTVLENH